MKKITLLTLLISNFLTPSFSTPVKENFSIPDKPFFIKQCSIPPKINIISNILPIQFNNLPIQSNEWGNIVIKDGFIHHPLGKAYLYFSLKNKSVVAMKINKPDYCTYIETLDIQLDITPVIYKTQSLNNQFFTCTNKEIEKRETELLSKYINIFNKNMPFFNSSIIDLKQNLFPLYSTSNQILTYENNLSNRLDIILKIFIQQLDQSQSSLNNQLNQQRDYSFINKCKNEKEYVEEFLHTLKAT